MVVNLLRGREFGEDSKTNLALGIIYKYHIDLGAGIMITGILIVIASVLITTTFTIFTAANTNPARILRTD